MHRSIYFSKEQEIILKILKNRFRDKSLSGIIRIAIDKLFQELKK